MSQSEVFRPSNGDLFVRDPVASSPPVSADMFRKRPASQSGYRFGQMSHNSFFTRHNPHPNRVRHLKGLLDVPICSVNDDGYFASPRYSLQFPPNNYNLTRLANSHRNRIPVNALNVNSQLHPINTITGLQYFTGLNSFPFREKAIPKMGMVPVTEAWRDELKAFTDQLSQEKPKEPEKPLDERPRTTQYSSETGRLIPPPSRAMSRGASRKGRQPNFNMQHIAAEPDLENVVLTMLCQILQTDDVNAVQSWLVSAGEREKTMVMDMIRGAIAGREEYNKQYPAQFVPERPRSVLPPITDNQIIGDANEDMIDRLTLKEEPVAPKDPPVWLRATNNVEPVEPMPGLPAATPPESKPAVPVPPPSQPQLPMKPSTPKAIVEDDGFPIKPPTNDVFRPTSRPATQGGRASMMNGLDPKPPGTAEARLKYTKSPLVNGAMPDTMWNQHQSVSNNVNTF